MAHRPDAKHQQLGGRLGPRIAQLVQQAMADYHLRTAGHKALQSAEGANEFFRGMSREKAQHTRGLWELYLGGADTPAELEAVLRFIAHGQGELSEVMGSLGLGQVVGTSILSGIQNYVAPLNQKLIEALPNTLIDPASVATLIQRGFVPDGEGESEAAKGGVNAHRLNWLRHLATQFPGLNELLELWRRGLISEVEVREGLERNAISGEYVPGLLALKRVHLAPADLALMSLRGIIDQTEGEQAAAVSGYTAHDFDLLVKATGEPPGLMQLLEAYRRGFINTERLETGIRQSRVRNEWTDVVEKLRFSPASPSDALRGVIQGHLSDAEGKQIAEWNGLRPEDWNWLRETEGNPLAPGELMELWNRGVIDQAHVEQGIKEGRTKDKYIPAALHLRVKLPEGRQVTQMIGHGAITRARGMTVLRDLGYEQDIAEGLLNSATSGQVLREKNLAAGQVAELFHDHAITEADALKHLEVLGYHPENARFILHLTELQRERKLQEAAISPIHSMYIARHIGEPEASAALDKLGIAAAQKDYLLALWNIERFDHRKSLTEAQIVKANEKGLFTDQVALERLQGLGYTGEDARILLDLEKNRTVGA